MSIPVSLSDADKSFFSFGNVTPLFTRWAPRAIVGGLAGYYSLGYAYDVGIMAAIDRIAIRILRHHVGYIGLGAIMPTVQWYAAWGVRLTSALLAGIAYDVSERIVLCSIRAFYPPHPQASTI